MNLLFATPKSNKVTRVTGVGNKRYFFVTFLLRALLFVICVTVLR